MSRIFLAPVVAARFSPASTNKRHADRERPTWTEPTLVPLNRAWLAYLENHFTPCQREYTSLTSSFSADQKPLNVQPLKTILVTIGYDIR
ncbi:MAG: hypothetical protein AUJ07_00390 [Crenarchaeota archaeon 13_1_40CM_3_53_5]|nr:MAG: hypothetical protein AUJ07_00390 [Crenarchaeota archaeon 13_1_40CM_3_53_5]